MPRRNRNVNALRIDADELADQADRLTAELGHPDATTIYYPGLPLAPERR
jgi:hypothetical protein